MDTPVSLPLPGYLYYRSCFRDRSPPPQSCLGRGTGEMIISIPARPSIPLAPISPSAQAREPRLATTQQPSGVVPSSTRASTTCWRSSLPPRHPPVSSGLLVHPRIPSLLLVPVTRRFPPLQHLHRCKHLHLRTHLLGRVGVSAKRWSQIQQVSCTCSPVVGDPPSPKSSLTAILYTPPMRIKLTHSSHGGVRKARVKSVVRFRFFFGGASSSPPTIHRPPMGKPH